MKLIERIRKHGVKKCGKCGYSAMFFYTLDDMEDEICMDCMMERLVSGEYDITKNIEYAIKKEDCDEELMWENKEGR